MPERAVKNHSLGWNKMAGRGDAHLATATPTYTRQRRAPTLATHDQSQMEH
jgi:hypothetical protein